jgi:hypothetical protein
VRASNLDCSSSSRLTMKSRSTAVSSVLSSRIYRSMLPLWQSRSASLLSLMIFTLHGRISCHWRELGFPGRKANSVLSAVKTRVSRTATPRYRTTSKSKMNYEALCSGGHRRYRQDRMAEHHSVRRENARAGVTEFQALPAGSALKQFHRGTTSGFETRSPSAGHSAKQRALEWKMASRGQPSAQQQAW